MVLLTVNIKINPIARISAINIMKEVITLRMILESRFPKGSRLRSKKNTNFTKPKKR